MRPVGRLGRVFGAEQRGPVHVTFEVRHPPQVDVLTRDVNLMALGNVAGDRQRAVCRRVL